MATETKNEHFNAGVEAGMAMIEAAYKIFPRDEADDFAKKFMLVGISLVLDDEQAKSGN